MLYRSGQFIFIQPKDDAVCQLYGKVDELRPYGPNGAEVCFDCGMKDPETTNARLNHYLFGDPLPENVR